MKHISLTDHEGDVVIIVVDHICSLALGVSDSRETVTLVRTTGGTDIVRESIETILALCSEAEIRADGA